MSRSNKNLGKSFDESSEDEGPKRRGNIANLISKVSSDLVGQLPSKSRRKIVSVNRADTLTSLNNILDEVSDKAESWSDSHSCRSHKKEPKRTKRNKIASNVSTNTSKNFTYFIHKRDTIKGNIRNATKILKNNKELKRQLTNSKNVIKRQESYSNNF